MLFISWSSLIEVNEIIQLGFYFIDSFRAQSHDLCGLIDNPGFPASPEFKMAKLCFMVSIVNIRQNLAS